jgi:hypothetical protein
MNKHLSTALYAILKPLISLMYRNGMGFSEFSQLAKLAYIEVIEKELIRSNQKATTSQIAISSGLTRKEVSSLRKKIAPDQAINIKQNRATRVISAWISDTQFCDQQGKAKVLSILGEDETFEQLVAQYSGDMPHRAMMKELLRTGAIETRENIKVGLLRAAYIPSADENEMYSLLGEDVSLLLSTIKHNITNKENEPLYQRKVSYDRISVEHIVEFRKLAKKENQLLLVKLNSWLAKHDMNKQTVIGNGDSMKVGVGAYYFETKSKNSKGLNNES